MKRGDYLQAKRIIEKVKRLGEISDDLQEYLRSESNKEESEEMIEIVKTAFEAKIEALYKEFENI